MVNLFIKITQEERIALKRIVKALGFSTMTKWLKSFIQENSKKEGLLIQAQEDASRAQDEPEKIAPRPLEEGKVIS